MSGLRLTLAVMTTAAILAASPLSAADPPAHPAWRRHTIDAADRTAGKLGADGVRLADINHDGRLDVATGWEQGGAIRVCLNPGPKLARKPWPVGRVRSPEDAVFGDLDGDGQFDVISCCEGSTRQIFVHWAPSSRRRQLDPAAWTTGSIPAVAGKQAWMYALPPARAGCCCSWAAPTASPNTRSRCPTSSVTAREWPSETSMAIDSRIS